MPGGTIAQPSRGSNRWSRISRSKKRNYRADPGTFSRRRTTRLAARRDLRLHAKEKCALDASWLRNEPLSDVAARASRGDLRHLTRPGDRLASVLPQAVVDRPERVREDGVALHADDVPLMPTRLPGPSSAPASSRFAEGSSRRAAALLSKK